MAINIAEEMIEARRTFGQVTASNDVDAFNNIVSGNSTVTRGGLEFDVAAVVTDFYYNPDTASFQNSKPHADIVNADLKRLELTVAWGGTGENVRNFQIDESSFSSNLGTGTITLVDLISSFTTKSAGKVVLNDGSASLYSPPVDYNPGENPDIISIQLGANKFKESTTPLPDVVRADELVETRFDVVTYSQNDEGATFLRREEFRALSCECTLQIPSAGDEGGLRPTIWDGLDYTQGEFVSKPYGLSANNQQSDYCDLCCRDHHDGGTGSEDDANDPGRSRYNPFRSGDDYHTSGSLLGDHKHYNRDNVGNLVVADSHGDTYVEACRMVRKDGFWRVAQDLRQEGLNAFPADFLDESSEVSTYSSYVTAAVSGYEADMGGTNLYESNPPTMTAPADMDPAVVFPASTYENATEMSAASGVTEQQLRSRGIYIDYMSDELRTKINCLDLGGEGADCEVPDVGSALEIIPFYDVQLTWLSRWTETPNNNPIDVTNEAVADNNVHSRGVASLESGFGYSTISSSVHSGNLGLTATDPIDPWYSYEEENYDMFALAVDYSTPPPLSGVIVSGNITSAVPGVKAADVEIEATDAQCDRTNTGYECVIETGANTPRLKVFNYFKQTRELYACSAELVVHGTEHSGDSIANSWTRFNLPYVGSTTAHIVIKEGGC
jgi:hypothetical protein